MLKFKAIPKLLAPALLACCLSTTAFAEIYPGAVEQALNNHEINAEWPFPAVCIGSDVNLRSEPNTNCQVITMLQPNDNFYIKRVIQKSDYTWMEGITDKGEHGFMVSKYLDPAQNAASRRERFRAALATTKIYDPQRFAAACGTVFPNKYMEANPEVFHYATHKVQVGNNWVHGEAFEDNFHVIGVEIKAPGYKLAGIEVGDSFTYPQAQQMNRDMMYVGWDDAQLNGETDKYYWYRSEAVDGQERPVEGVAIITKNKIITQINYFHIPID